MVASATFDTVVGSRTAKVAQVFGVHFSTPNDVADFGRLIDELLDDPQRRSEMGRVGRERIETELGWSNTQKNLLAAYAWLFGK